MKHTKGPWKVHGNTNQGLTIANDSMLGYLAIVPKQADLNQTLHDAKLIAAAPELLEILKILVDHAQEKYPHFESDRGQAEIKRALDVIRKAEN